jgi:hypothetical protein
MKDHRSSGRGLDRTLPPILTGLQTSPDPAGFNLGPASPSRLAADGPDILTPRVSSACGRGSGEDRKPVLKLPDVAGITEGLLTEAGAGCEKECLPPLTFLAAGAVRALWSLSVSEVGSLPPAIVTADRPDIPDIVSTWVFSGYGPGTGEDRQRTDSSALLECLLVSSWLFRLLRGVRWLPRLLGVSPVRSRTSNLFSSTKLLRLPVSRSTSSFLVFVTSS